MYINGIFVPKVTPDFTKAGCIEVYENIWPNPDKTIEDLEKVCQQGHEYGASWSPAETIGSGVFQKHRTNLNLNLTYACHVTENKILQNIHNTFLNNILATSSSYREKFEINENFHHEDYQCLKYQCGQEYKAHCDSTTEHGRTISILCYLNDDYEGGEIEFVNFNVKIKPKAGSMILFPSNFAYSHIAHPIKSGTKYAFVTWIRGKNL